MRILERFGAAVAAFQGKTLSGTGTWQIWGSGVSSSPMTPEELLAAYTSWVYACVDIRAKSVAAARFRLYKRVGVDEFEEIEDHPMYELLERPNPWETKVEFFQRTVQYLDLLGDSYWNVSQNGLRRPAELWILPSEAMKIIPSERDFISGYELRKTGGGKVPFSVDEIVHLKYPNPANPYYGMAPLQAAHLGVKIDKYQNVFQTKFYQNSALPPVILETEKGLTPGNRDELRDHWHQLYGGENQGKTAVLDNGLKAKPLGINPKDLDWLASNRTTRDQILAIFGVPASKLGLVEDVNRASAVANDYTLAVNVVEPILKLIDAKLTLDIAKRFDPRLVVIHDSTVPRDRTEEANTMRQRLDAGMTTRNEERKQLGYKPVSSAEANVLLVPLNYVSIERINEVQNGKGSQ